MDTNNIFRRLGPATAGVAASLLAVHGAVAADAPSTAVVTTRADIPTMTVVGRSDKGAPIVMYEVSHVVKVRDLNLATPAGVAAFESRVRTAAVTGCGELHRLSPAYHARRLCVHEAMMDVRSAMDAAITEARAQAKVGST